MKRMDYVGALLGAWMCLTISPAIAQTSTVVWETIDSEPQEQFEISEVASLDPFQEELLLAEQFAVVLQSPENYRVVRSSPDPQVARWLKKAEKSVSKMLDPEFSEQTLPKRKATVLEFNKNMIKIVGRVEMVAKPVWNLGQTM